MSRSSIAIHTSHHTPDHRGKWQRFVYSKADDEAGGPPQGRLGPWCCSPGSQRSRTLRVTCWLSSSALIWLTLFIFTSQLYFVFCPNHESLADHAISPQHVSVPLSTLFWFRAARGPETSGPIHSCESCSVAHEAKNTWLLSWLRFFWVLPGSGSCSPVSVCTRDFEPANFLFISRLTWMGMN